jgi:hypothetical protein
MKRLNLLWIAAFFGIVGCGASEDSGEPLTTADLGIPWAKCSTPPKPLIECTDKLWKASPYAMNASLVRGSCKSGWCRADLASGSQCAVDDTTVCGSKATGQSICGIDGWGPCSVP